MENVFQFSEDLCAGDEKLLRKTFARLIFSIGKDRTRPRARDPEPWRRPVLRQVALKRTADLVNAPYQLPSIPVVGGFD